MKLQGFSIIFALIAMPIILVLTYYVQLHIDTIAIQNDYDSKLLDATYDAMSSFEINTANEELSSVSDSLRTIIEASNNIFFNTLSTNLGLSNASKSYVEPYIPAILYTLYDGYYISSPTQVPTVLTNESGVALAVGDEGVYKKNGVYKYDKSNSDVLEYANVDNDYGQLLFLKDGETDIYTSKIEEAEMNTKNVLKTYMPYSARYKKTEGGKLIYDVTVIYTLDNYVTIEGKVRQSDIADKYIYYTKSGYLIAKDSVTISGNDKILGYNQNEAQEYIEQGNNITITIGDINFTSGNPISIEETRQVVRDDGTAGNEINVIDNIKDYATLNQYLNSSNNKLREAKNMYYQKSNEILSISETTQTDKYNQTQNDIALYQQTIEREQKNINNITYALDQMSAAIYYTKATIFSNWVYDLFANTANETTLIREKYLVEISGQTYKSIDNIEEVTYEFKDSDLIIFDIAGTIANGETEVDSDSPFYKHKMNVIRNSIQYNLNLAMSTYNTQTSSANNYEMPVLQNEEWNQILNNVSIVSFMQGYSCGLKTYNNYKVVSSTNNEITVQPENIYYVEDNKFCDEVTEYHKIDCPKFIENDKATSEIENYISFSSKDVKYDKIKNNNAQHLKIEYDHKNLACYDCINDGNYASICMKHQKKECEDCLKEGKLEAHTNIFEKDATSNMLDDWKNLRKAYYIAVGSERNDLYKMNAIDNSEGYEIIFYQGGNLTNTNSTLPLKDIKSIEIVLGTIKTRNTKENLRYEYTINGTTVSAEDALPNSITSNESSNTTLTIDLNPDVFYTMSDKFSLNTFSVKNTNQDMSTVYLNTSDEDWTTIAGSKDEYNNKIFKNAIKCIKIIYK